MPTSSKVIAVDVDGVLANFFQAYEELTITTSGRDRFGEHRWPKQSPPTWNWPEFYGYTADEMRRVWNVIKQSTTFWNRLLPLPGASEFLNRLQLVAASEVYFITDRPSPTAQAQTQYWLDTMGFAYPSVIISKEGKGPLCANLKVDLFVDDKLANASEVAHTCPSARIYLLDYPYNQGLVPSNVTRIKSLKEVQF